MSATKTSVDIIALRVAPCSSFLLINYKLILGFAPESTSSTVDHGFVLVAITAYSA